MGGSTHVAKLEQKFANGVVLVCLLFDDEYLYYCDSLFLCAGCEKDFHFFFDDEYLYYMLRASLLTTEGSTNDVKAMPEAAACAISSTVAMPETAAMPEA